jgi:hypothetical protein
MVFLFSVSKRSNLFKLVGRHLCDATNLRSNSGVLKVVGQILPSDEMLLMSEPGVAQTIVSR